jgi:hypothetical protein
MSSQVRDWLKGAFAVQTLKGSEASFQCPFCGHHSFYFNFRKMVGFCHRASCGRKPTLKDLIELKGYGPTDYYTQPAPVEVLEPAEVALPEGVHNVSIIDDWWMTVALECRGISESDIYNWCIKASHDRVYIPVWENDKLVQYVGRSIDRTKPPEKGFDTNHKQRFKYASGSSISKYLFGYDFFKSWDSIVLVESTFNAISWWSTLNCTTNFGSHLSDIQIKLIQHSKIKRVIFAWDSDAKLKAFAAAKKLSNLGIRAAVLYFGPDYNQPDEVDFNKLDHSIKCVMRELLEDTRDFNNPMVYKVGQDAS